MEYYITFLSRGHPTQFIPAGYVVLRVNIPLTSSVNLIKVVDASTVMTKLRDDIPLIQCNWKSLILHASTLVV